MRLWSIYPEYLDAKGLVALWREGLLAKHVLEGKTKGYRNHPQLNRFKAQENPVLSIHCYLFHVLKEAEKRGYRFDASKINDSLEEAEKIQVTQGQMMYEWHHLRQKVQQRTPSHFETIQNILTPEPHPLFEIVPGCVESWEKV